MDADITSGVTTLREHAAEEVRALLGRRRTSATQLARQMGVSQAYVWRRLSGETAFDLDDLEKISALLDVEVTDLLPRRTGGRTVTVAGDRKVHAADRRRTLNARKSTLTERPQPKGPAARLRHDDATRRPVRAGARP